MALRVDGRRFAVRWATALVAASLALSPRAARAADRTSSLSWLRLEGAEGCVATQELAKAVEARLGRAAFVSAANADLSIEGHVRRVGRVFRAEVRVRGAAGQLLGSRTLEDASCDALREPLALVIALMIDPDAASRSPPSGPAAKVSEPSPAGAAERAPPSGEAREPPREAAREIEVRREVVVVPAAPSEWRGEGDARGELGAGLLPSLAVGVGVGAWQRRASWPALAASATYWFEQAPVVRGPTGTTASVELDFVQAGAGLCPLVFEREPGLRRPRLAALACLGGRLGLMRGTGLGFDRSERDSQVTLHGALELRGSVGLVGPVVAHAGLVGLVSALGAQRFAYRSGAELLAVHEIPRLGGVGTVGLGVHLP